MATKIRVVKTVTPTEGEKPVDNKIRQEWNKYVDWLATKGLRGHPDLDKNDLGGKMVDLYKKEHPDTPISRETIPIIQKEFSNYRDWSLNEIKLGKSGFAPGVNEENYMRALSVVDGIPGQRTTSFKFPETYLTTFNNRKNMGITNQGFATVKPTK